MNVPDGLSALTLRSWGMPGVCARLRAPSGASLRSGCIIGGVDDAQFRVTNPAAGRYHVEVTPNTGAPGRYDLAWSAGTPPSTVDPTLGIDVPQDDAGSGRDAPDQAIRAVPITGGRVYQGNFTGVGFVGDWADFYAFDAPMGSWLNLRVTVIGSITCIEVHAPSGSAATERRCNNAIGTEMVMNVPLRETGSHRLLIEGLNPATYFFSLGLGEPAPLLTPMSLDQGTGVEPQATATGQRPENAVIALIDSGINPYHIAFRDPSPRALQHPSTYLPGYPADAEAIHITFGHANLTLAVAADCAEWAKVVPGKLYWFPGTRIVGDITFPYPKSDPTILWDIIDGDTKGTSTCEDPSIRGEENLVGTSSHGTMTASRAAGAGYGGCPDCLIVEVQGAGAEHVRWAASQAWIDVQSNSWAPVTPVYFPAENPSVLAATPDLIRAVEESARIQPSFWGSGNGAAFRHGVLGHPTQIVPHFGPHAIRVGATDSGEVAIWGGSFPHVASDGCDSWAAQHNTMGDSGPDVGGGTSAATPFVAGSAARVLREARIALGDTRTGPRGGDVIAQGSPVGTGALADGQLTRAEWLAALFHTAEARPAATPEDAGACNILNFSPLPIHWADVPAAPGAQIPFIGYGAVTRASGDQALRVLLGEAPLPARDVEDAWLASDTAAHETSYAVYTAPPN